MEHDDTVPAPMPVAGLVAEACVSSFDPRRKTAFPQGGCLAGASHRVAGLGKCMSERRLVTGHMHIIYSP